MADHIYAALEVGNLPGVKNPHITLAYLGDYAQVYRYHVHPLEQMVMSLTCMYPENLYADGLRHEEWPGQDGGRLNVVPVELDPRLAELAQLLRVGMWTNGMPWSNRFPFRPHITLPTGYVTPVQRFLTTGVMVAWNFNGRKARTTYRFGDQHGTPHTSPTE